MRPYTEREEQRFLEVLKEIQRNVPAMLRQTVVIETPISPNVERVMKEALDTPGIDPLKKEQIQHVLDTGVISQKVNREDPHVAKQIDNYVNREINKAIKAGRLPPKNRIKYLPSMMKFNENQNQKANN